MTTSRRSFLAAGAALPAAGFVRAQPQESELPHPGRTPTTRFAVNLEMWWTDRPFLERIQAAAALRFPAVEFWGWKGKELDKIGLACSELGLTIAQFTGWGFTPGLNDPANHDAFVTAIREGCEVAHRLQCKKMTVVGGNDQPGMSQEEMHANIIAGLRRAAPIAEEEDITLILEPMNIRVDHKGHCLYTSPDAVRICREVGSSHVKINWDLYHLQISEGDLCGHLEEGFDQVGYIQVADHPGRTEPGTGEIYYPRVFRKLQELGYRDFVGLECRPKDSPREAAERIHRLDTET